MMSSDSDNPFDRVFDQMKKDMVKDLNRPLFAGWGNSFRTNLDPLHTVKFRPFRNTKDLAVDYDPETDTFTVCSPGWEAETVVFTADEMKALCLEIIAFIDRKLYP